ncbi:MAG: rhodanese-like domain-containing protein [Bacteroidota bacterium]
MYTNLITVAQLQELINEPSLVVVDCRFSLADKEQGRRDYHEAHIPGAHYAHLDDDR